MGNLPLSKHPESNWRLRHDTNANKKKNPSSSRRSQSFDRTAQSFSNSSFRFFRHADWPNAHLDGGVIPEKGGSLRYPCQSHRRGATMTSKQAERRAQKPPLVSEMATNNVPRRRSDLRRAVKGSVSHALGVVQLVFRLFRDHAVGLDEPGRAVHCPLSSTIPHITTYLKQKFSTKARTWTRSWVLDRALRSLCRTQDFFRCATSSKASILWRCIASAVPFVSHYSICQLWSTTSFSTASTTTRQYQ